MAWLAQITRQHAVAAQDQIGIAARYYDDANPAQTLADYWRYWPTTATASEIEADIVAYGQAQREVLDRLALLPNYVGTTIAVP